MHKCVCVCVCVMKQNTHVVWILTVAYVHQFDVMQLLFVKDFGTERNSLFEHLR